MQDGQNSSIIKKIFSKILPQSPFLLALALASLDLFKYQGFVSKHLGVSVLASGVFLALLQLTLKLVIKIKTNFNLSRLLLFGCWPLSMAAALTMSALEKFELVFPNYFFATFGLDWQSLAIFSWVLFFFALVNIERKFYQKNYRKLHLLFSLTLLMGAAYLFLNQQQFYLSLIAEDGLIEILEVLAFASAVFLAWQLSRQMFLYFPKALVQQKIARGLLLLASLALALIVGEELSWGQRLFGFATPANIESINRQVETNLHNLESVWPLVYWSYLILGLLGSTLWLGRSILHKFFKSRRNLWQWSQLLVPDAYLFFNFALISLYVLLRFRYGVWRFVAMEELSELFLAIGISLHLFEKIKAARSISVSFEEK